MSIMTNTISSIISAAMFFLFRDRVIDFLKQKNLTVENYKHKHVLTGGGLLLLFPILSGPIPDLFMTGLQDKAFFYGSYSLVSLVLVFCGLLDDLLGESQVKGFVGHIRFFLMGRLTTGFIKALTGGTIGFILALSRYERISTFLLDVLTFSLSVNTINLLDLRPGRAVKGFFIILVPVLAASCFSEVWILVPVITALICYLGGELKENYMLGDAGANLLGGILGYYSVISLSLTGKTVMTLLLGTLQLLTEFHSLTKLIESVPLLKKIDMLGRKN